MVTVLISQATGSSILDEIKAHLNIDQDIDDERLNALIDAACHMTEVRTGVPYLASTYDRLLPGFCRTIYLPEPVTSVTSVKYYDADDALQTFDSGSWSFVNNDTGLSFVEIGADVELPATYSRSDAVQVRFVREPVSDATFLHAVKLLVGLLNERREGENADFRGWERLCDLIATGEYR